MAVSRCWPTKYVGLWYRNDGASAHKKSAWYFVRASTRESFGPPFADKIDLLAAQDTFAAANGFTELEVSRPVNPPEPPKPAPVVAPQPQRIAIEPGMTVAALWAQCSAGLASVVSADDLTASRAIFHAGFFAALEAFSRGGEVDVSPEEATDWLANMRRECIQMIKTKGVTQ